MSPIFPKECPFSLRIGWRQNYNYYFSKLEVLIVSYFEPYACLFGVNRFTIWTSELVYASVFILGSLGSTFFMSETLPILFWFKSHSQILFLEELGDMSDFFTHISKCYPRPIFFPMLCVVVFPTSFIFFCILSIVIRVTSRLIHCVWFLNLLSSCHWRCFTSSIQENNLITEGFLPGVTGVKRN